MSQLSRTLLQRTQSICVLVNEKNSRAHSFYERAGFKRRAIYDTIAGTAVVYDWDAEAMRIREIANRGGRQRALDRASGEEHA